MNASKKRSIGQAFAATVAAAVLSLAAFPAQANLQLRIQDVNAANVVVATILICDNNIGVGCLPGGDTNITAEVITVDTTLVNAILAAAGSKFTFASAGANDNIATATTLAIVNSNFQVSVGTGAQQSLVIEASRDGWLIPVGNPRTLTNGPSAVMTQTTGNITSQGFNDGTNALFGTQFATAASVFVAGVGPLCTPLTQGGVSTCNDLTTLNGINESNPYSLSNRQTVSSPATDGPPLSTTYLANDAATKFATPQAPEPATLLLMGAGLAALGFGRRRWNS